MPEAVDKYQDRFRFLFPVGSKVRFRLCPPDIHELRWSVFDHEDRKSIGFGRTPEDAVDVAVEVLHQRQFIPPYPDDLLHG
jgi:hypothetical protein